MLLRFVMGPEFVRRAAVMVAEAAMRVAVAVMVVGVMGRRRLLRESGRANDRGCAYGERSDDL